MKEFLTDIWPIICVTLLEVATVVGGFLLVNLIRTIKKKISISNDQAINDSMYMEIERLINNCVVAVNQKFVESVKKKYGSLSEEDAEFAFNMAKSMIISMLTTENIEFIKNKYVDVDKFIEYLIEFDVYENKLRYIGPALDEDQNVVETDGANGEVIEETTVESPSDINPVEYDSLDDAIDNS